MYIYIIYIHNIISPMKSGPFPHENLYHPGHIVLDRVQLRQGLQIEAIRLAPLRAAVPGRERWFIHHGSTSF